MAILPRGVGIAMAAALTFAAPAGAETVVRVGLINSSTGLVAQAADQAKKAINLYLKLHESMCPPASGLISCRWSRTRGRS